MHAPLHSSLRSSGFIAHETGCLAGFAASRKSLSPLLQEQLHCKEERLCEAVAFALRSRLGLEFEFSGLLCVSRPLAALLTMTTYVRSEVAGMAFSYFSAIVSAHTDMPPYAFFFQPLPPESISCDQSQKQGIISSISRFNGTQ